MGVDSITRAAWEILLQSGICSLPVKPALIARRQDIFVYTYTQYTAATGRSLLEVASRYGTDGFTQRTHGCYAVFYNATNPIPRIRWTLAHELGHIFLGHLSGQYPLRSQGEEKARADVEADQFAAALLCPCLVAHLCGAASAEELRELADLSIQAASIQWQALCSKRMRGGLFQEEGLGKRLAESFSPFIREYRKERRIPAPAVETPRMAFAMGRL